MTYTVSRDELNEGKKKKYLLFANDRIMSIRWRRDKNTRDACIKYKK